MFSDISSIRHAACSDEAVKMSVVCDVLLCGQRTDDIPELWSSDSDRAARRERDTAHGGHGRPN